jgi:enamidase
MPSLLLENIGTLLTGDLQNPRIEADAVYVEDGVIREVGTRRRADQVIDAQGSTVMPGTVDCHHHPYFGDYHPVISTVGYTERYVEGGVTSVISLGPYAMPGHPLGAPYGKALAILTTQSFQKVRPSGIKVFAETMIVEPGMQQADLAEAAAAGVKRIKFLLPIPTVAETRQVVEWAHALGMQVQAHCGGRKLVGESGSIGEALRVISPDIAAHLNGGPTPPAWEDAVWLVDNTSCYVDLVFGGNFTMAAALVRRLMERGQLERAMIGTDSPTPGGSAPNGTAKLAAFICSTTDLTAEQAACLISGTAGRAYGLPIGIIAVDKPADLLVCDARDGSVAANALEEFKNGNNPSVGAVIVDGEVLFPTPAPRFPSGKYHGRSNPKRPPVFGNG